MYFFHFKFKKYVTEITPSTYNKVSEDLISPLHSTGLHENCKLGSSFWLFVCWLMILSTPTDARLYSFPWQDIMFPKNPEVTKVRSLSEARSSDPSAILHFTILVQQHGYPAEEHHITTDDGYQIEFHRIPGSPLSSSTNKPVVFLQHGMSGSSDNWVLIGPGRDFVYLLADAGYDVWMGNIRGNSYGRSHVNLSTSSAAFWKFSFDEFALQDVRLQIDYALKVTGKDKVEYVGHSMGTTILFILLSSMPEYNEKISLGVSFSPVAYWEHKFTSLFDHFVRAAAEFKSILDGAGIYDFVPQNLVPSILGEDICADNSVTQPLCIYIIDTISGRDPDQLNTTMLPYALKYVPAGISTQAVNHYNQNLLGRRFSRYDYGPSENMKRYNQRKPPHYNVEKITAPMALFYGSNDGMIKKEDVMELNRRLNSVVYIEEIPYKYFTHFDFLFAIQAKELLYDRVIKLMLKYRE